MNSEFVEIAARHIRNDRDYTVVLSNGWFRTYDDYQDAMDFFEKQCKKGDARIVVMFNKDRDILEYAEAV